jgi:hypothetical protein
MRTGSVDGTVRAWLRVEGLALLLAAASCYAVSGRSWGTCEATAKDAHARLARVVEALRG